MRIGLTLGGDLRDLPLMAREAEDAGFESLWVAETARSAFVQAAVAVSATSRVTVGTALALAFPRSPTITAMAARDLAELSGGRFILGLGSQVKGVNTRRFSLPFEHPAARIAEAVEVIRDVLGTFEGKPIDHRGRFYEVTMPPFPGAGPAPARIPIYLGAVNPLMAETAGRCADGIVGHPMASPRYLREVISPAVERGAAAAGRSAGDISVTTMVIVQIADDPEVARREAAAQLAFYATTRTYAPILSMHGFEALGPPLRDAYARGDVGAMTDLAMPMVDALAVAGHPEECRAKLAGFEGVVDRVLLSGAWVGPSAERIAENHRAIVETLAPGA